MATTATLTPKQQQVKSLLDQGKSPAEVAKKLKVNVNSVYQHIRRMRDAEGGAPAKPKRTTARKSTARKTGGKRTARKSTARRSPARRSGTSPATNRRRPAPAPAPVAEARAMTPLQAIRHRKSEIESQITESGRRVAVAEKAYNDEKDSHAKLEANRADELKQLTAAEAALTGKSTAKPRSRSASKNGSGSKAAAQAAAPAATPEPQSAGTGAPVPAQPDPTPAETDGATGSTTEVPEPVEPPTGDDALAAVGAEQERPGVETLPEFTQEGEDPFAGE